MTRKSNIEQFLKKNIQIETKIENQKMISKSEMKVNIL